jgi:hypothetical protein
MVARQRPYSLLLIVLLAGLAVPFLTRERTEWDHVFVAAADRLLAGEDLYKQPTGYTYPPFQAMFAAPVAGWPQSVQRGVWFAVNALCLAWLLRAAWRLAGDGPLQVRRDYPEHLACWLGLGVGLCFLLNALAHQQTDILLAALVVGGIERLVHNQPVRAATFFGLASAMKCTPLLFVPYLLIRYKPFAAGWLVTVALGASLLPDLVARPATGGTWLGRWSAEYLEPMARPDYTPGVWASEIIYNQSLVGLTNRWATTTWEAVGGKVVVQPVLPATTPGEMKGWLLAAALVCGGLALVGMRLARRRSDQTAVTVWECGMVVAGMLLFSPMSSPAHFGLLLLPGFALARAAVVHCRAWAWPVLAVALAGALLTNKDLWGDLVYTVGLWYGAATLTAVACLFGCVCALVIKPVEPPAMATIRSQRGGHFWMRIPVRDIPSTEPDRSLVAQSYHDSSEPETTP